jgi:hypothetical protein
VLAAMLNATVPFPLPLAPDVIVSHDALLLAVHAHPLWVVTPTEPLDAVSGAFWPADESENEHGAAPAACVTVNIWPAIVKVPFRAAPVLAATLYATVPLPVPVAPEVMVSHDALLVAVHAQPDPLVTVTVPVLAVAGAFWLADPIEYEHVAAPAACDTVNVWPATTTLPLRAAPVLAATL